MTEKLKQSDWSVTRGKFPEVLFNELNRLSGGLKWSMDKPNFLYAESLAAIIPFLRNSRDVKVVEDGDYDEHRQSLMIEINGEIFKIYERNELKASEVMDKVFSPNLEVIRNYLNNPQARVLYIGSNSDRSAKDVFGNNAINLDLQGDRLSSGDVKADATKTPFPDSTFDLVVLKNSNDIIQNPELRKEIYRILRNGGVLFNSANTGPEYERGRDVEVDERRLLTRAGIDRVYLEDDEAHFEPLDIHGIHFAKDMTLLKVVK